MIVELRTLVCNILVKFPSMESSSRPTSCREQANTRALHARVEYGLLTS